MPYFTIAEARKTDPAFNDPATYPDADISRVLNAVESSIEAATQTAFIVRTATERLSGTGQRMLQLGRYPVRSVTAVRVYTGATFTDYTAADLADLVVDGIGGIYRYSLGSFAAGRNNIEVTYTYGYDSPAAAPAGYLIDKAARVLFRYWLKADKANIDPAMAGVRSISVEGLSTSYGSGDGPTEIRDVDRLIAQWMSRDGVVVA